MCVCVCVHQSMFQQIQGHLGFFAVPVKMFRPWVSCLVCGECWTWRHLVLVCVLQALGMLFWHKHNVDRALTDLANFTPFPDEWTVEDKVLFEQAFSFHGKSFHRIRQMVSAIDCTPSLPLVNNTIEIQIFNSFFKRGGGIWGGWGLRWCTEMNNGQWCW